MCHKRDIVHYSKSGDFKMKKTLINLILTAELAFGLLGCTRRNPAYDPCINPINMYTSRCNIPKEEIPENRSDSGQEYNPKNDAYDDSRDEEKDSGTGVIDTEPDVSANIHTYGGDDINDSINDCNGFEVTFEEISVEPHNISYSTHYPQDFINTERTPLSATFVVGDRTYDKTIKSLDDIIMGLRTTVNAQKFDVRAGDCLVVNSREICFLGFNNAINNLTVDGVYGDVSINHQKTTVINGVKLYVLEPEQEAYDATLLITFASEILLDRPNNRFPWVNGENLSGLNPIVLGTPCENGYLRQLLVIDRDSCIDSVRNLERGTGVIAMDRTGDNGYAIIVTGKDYCGIQKASKVLKHYGLFNFDFGSMQEVIVR